MHYKSCTQNPHKNYFLAPQDFRDVIDIVVHIEAHSGVRKFSDVYFKGAIDENKVT